MSQRRDSWQVRLTTAAHRAVLEHTLHPGDPVAFCTFGIDRKRRRILVRDVHPVADDDLLPGEAGGHRSVPARLVARHAHLASLAGLGLMWIHAHPGSGAAVCPSEQDRRTSRAANPMMATVTKVASAAIVVSETHATGTVWLPDGTTGIVGSMVVVGANIVELIHQPRGTQPMTGRYARQVMLFGNAGQHILADTTVAVIGAGGGGSVLHMLLTHLGVGRIISIDFDRVSASNLSRVIDSTTLDVFRRRHKVEVAARYTRRTSPETKTRRVVGDITYTDDAERILGADYIFLATDTAFARFAFNEICHQYLIPGCQIGAKVTTTSDGAVDLIYTAMRHVHFQHGCLLCNGLIPLDRLHDEQLTETQRRQQRYADTPDGIEIDDPSVVTLNTVVAGHAANTMLMSLMCLMGNDVILAQQIHYPTENETRRRELPRSQGCLACDPTSSISAFARGELTQLRLRRGSSPHLRVRNGPTRWARTLAQLKHALARLTERTR